MIRKTFCLPALVWTTFFSVASAEFSMCQTCRWTTIDAQGNPTARHENAFLEYKGKFYLIGGRGVNPVDVFDPKTNTWTALGKTPIDMHHFQPVVYGDAIYVVGAMQGKYPVETPLEHVWIYYPEEDRWEQGPEIPENRRRGGGGVVVFDDKIYLSCGIEFGHTSGTNNYFDCFDPETGEWEVLTKAPHIRDHFYAVVANGKLYNIGGRNTSYHTPERFGAFFDQTVPHVDVYDFEKGKWHTEEETLPYPTAAGGVVHKDDAILYFGGEAAWKSAYNQTQKMDLDTHRWSLLAPLVRGRHGTGAILWEDKIYVAAGSPKRGGGNLSSIEVFSEDHDWKSLFNGENLDGWSVKCTAEDKGNDFWTVKDGVIHCDSMESEGHSHVWLQSDEEFSDFVLRLKFQSFPEMRGNSGVQVRSRYNEDQEITYRGEKRLGWLNGPQVDVNPNAPFRNGFIYDETWGNKRWINPSLPNAKIDEATHKPKRIVHYFHNEGPGWNDLVIRCEGTRIQTWVNGELVSDYDGSGILDDENHKARRVGMFGHIALQVHTNSRNLIRYKDIEIRELD